ncbi:MAG: AsmA family protein [Terriglobales bacterium]
MKFLRSRRVVITAGLLLLLLFLVRPGANRLRTRIVSSISLALGRPVEVASVSLRLLPQPGFDLNGFVVEDDPAFGAEPMLRASEVTALLRLTPLLRGRLEISSLSLTEPSLNLVRNDQGHWNLENLLERAEKNPVAPTAKAKRERRPGFPYVEASRGRINFKFGAEKKPYALTEADFSLWQDSENAWSMRLKAQPMRTDFNLTDTGLVRVNGSWERAATLRDTPLNFTLLWDEVQLGQLTKLLRGADWGWRGTAELSAALTGTPANLAVTTSASADDFRRYNVLGGGDMRLGVHCNARFSSVDSRLSGIACQAPVGEGAISLSGSAISLLDSPGYDLEFNVQGMPMQSLLAFARHSKQGTPDDLVASGQLDAKVKVLRGKGSANRVLWEGGGQTSGLHLVSGGTNSELALDSFPLTFSSPAAGSHAHSPGLAPARVMRTAPEPRLEIGPFHVTLGRPTPVLLHGWVGRSGYEFEVQGEAQIPRLVQSARLIGLPILPTSADGSAKMNLQIVGDWSGVVAPRATGTAQLHSVQAKVRGWNAPLQIASANLTLTPDRTLVQNINASVAGTLWHGSLALPRPCAANEACLVTFDLHADELAIDRLNQLLNPNVRPRPWYRFLSSASGTPYLLTANASGRLTANRVVAGKLVQNHFSANLELKSGLLRLSDLHADILGGKHVGEWKADFTSKPPQYSGAGTVERVELGQLAEAMNDGWIMGSATATYRASASGLTSDEFLASAIGTLQVQAWEGSLPHIVLTEKAAPLQIRGLTARFALHNGKLEVENGKLLSADGIYQISGTASFSRVLNLKLTREGAPSFDITGTLSAPHVAQFAAPETRAALKP